MLVPQKWGKNNWGKNNRELEGDDKRQGLGVQRPMLEIFSIGANSKYEKYFGVFSGRAKNFSKKVFPSARWKKAENLSTCSLQDEKSIGLQNFKVLVFKKHGLARRF